jgi:hypothetical protein
MHVGTEPPTGGEPMLCTVIPAEAEAHPLTTTVKLLRQIARLKRAVDLLP